MSKRPVGRPDVRSVPRVRWAPKSKANDAADAIFLASSYGLTPDEWQADILRDWLGRKGTGKWAAGRCGLAVPRQNGKNGVIEVRELFGMVMLGEAILHTAHEVKTARKAFKRLKHFFGEKANDPGARFPELNALVKEVRSTNGQEAIFLKDVYRDGRFVRTGGSIEFVARSKGSGRGFTVDVLVLDEAQHLTDDELEAIRPAVSSAPLGNPQVIYTGTAPNIDKGELGEVWLRVRSKSGKDKRLCWIEYGAPDGPLPDLDDVALLFRVNPSLELRHGNGAFGLQMDTVNDEKGDLSPEGYARERLGWFGNPKVSRRGVIPMPRWRDLKVQADAEPTKAQVVVDVSPDLEWATVATASDHSGRALVLVDRHETSWDAVAAGETPEDDVEQLLGSDAVVAAVVSVVGAAEIIEVALTPTAKLLSAKLTKAGVEHKVLTNTEVGLGCTTFQDMIRGDRAAHVGQIELDDAVRNAITRYVGDTQHWDRRDRSVDISALVAGSTAAQRWELAMAAPDEPPPPPEALASGSTRSRDVASHLSW